MVKKQMDTLISKLTGKDRDDLTREDLVRLIETKEMEKVQFHYTGLDGRIKNLRLPVINKRQIEGILTDGERLDGSSLLGETVDTANSDLYVVPLYKTAFLNPFDDKSLDFMCRYFLKDGTLAPFALENILHTASNHFFKKHEFYIHALGELEFFLFHDYGKGVYENPPQRGYHEASPFTKSDKILDEIMAHLVNITGSVKYAHYEVANISNLVSQNPEIAGKTVDQLEIEFLPTPITETADNMIIARWIVRNVAYRNGCVASFTPKVDERLAGNALHFHMNLMKNGKNIIYDKNDELSQETLKIIGGLCKFCPALTAFGNTVASSYFRLVPYHEAPTHICWGDLNRSAMIRLPLGWKKISNLAEKINRSSAVGCIDNNGKETFEYRTADGSALIHLLLAGIIVAADWGLESSESLDIAQQLYVSGKNVYRKEYNDNNTILALPASCSQSAVHLNSMRECFEREGIFPKETINYVIRMLQNEKDEELAIKLSKLTASEKDIEIRRVMHKDLHRH